MEGNDLLPRQFKTYGMKKLHKIVSDQQYSDGNLRILFDRFGLITDPDQYQGNNQIGTDDTDYVCRIEQRERLHRIL